MDEWKSASPPTKKELDRIAWLERENTKRLGRRYPEAAREMAIAQVVIERLSKEKR